MFTICQQLQKYVYLGATPAHGNLILEENFLKNNKKGGL